MDFRLDQLPPHPGDLITVSAGRLKYLRPEPSSSTRAREIVDEKRCSPDAGRRMKSAGAGLDRVRTRPRGFPNKLIALAKTESPCFAHMVVPPHEGTRRYGEEVYIITFKPLSDATIRPRTRVCRACCAPEARGNRRRRKRRVVIAGLLPLRARSGVDQIR